MIANRDSSMTGMRTPRVALQPVLQVEWPKERCAASPEVRGVAPGPSGAIVLVAATEWEVVVIVATVEVREVW